MSESPSPLMAPICTFDALPSDPVRRRLAADFESLLRDRESLNVLLFVSQHYARLFDFVVERCFSLFRHSPLVYLLDFDVILNHLRTRNSDSLDTYATDFLFFRSQVPFAIPRGAWDELLDYFRHLTGIARAVRRNAQSETIDEAMHSLARALNVAGSRALGADALLSEICTRLSDESIELNRLAALVRNPRFRGVIADFEPEHREFWRDLVNAMPRDGEGPRDRKDDRDALNIAIATTSSPAIAQDPHGGTTQYVLVSQTAALRYLVRAINSPRLLRRARELLGHPAVLEHAFPVLQPRQVLTMEQLEAHIHPKRARRRARDFRRDFREVSDFIEEHVLEDDPATETPEEHVAAYIDEGRDRIRQLLERLSTEMLTAVSEIRSLEEMRATADSIELLRQRSSPAALPAQDTIVERSMLFLWAIGEATHALSDLPAMKCDIAFRQRQGKLPFARIEVLAGACGEAVPTLVTLELYPQRSDGATTYAYYSARWPVFCSDTDFLIGLKYMLRVREEACRARRSARPPTFSLGPIDAASDLWNEGVVIRTSIGEYGCTLDWVCDDPDLTALRFTNLTDAVSRACDCERRTGASIRPELQQIRVNTYFGDVAFDSVALDGASRRYLTVLSHFDLAEHLAALYEHTGTVYCVRRYLSDALHTALASIPSIPEEQR